MRRARFAIDHIDYDLSMTVCLLNHRQVGDDGEGIGAHPFVDCFNQVHAGVDLAERNHPAVVFVFQRRQLLAPVLHLRVRIQERHARVIGNIQRRARRFGLFSILFIKRFAMLLQDRLKARCHFGARRDFIERVDR